MAQNSHFEGYPHLGIPASVGFLQQESPAKKGEILWVFGQVLDN